MNILLVSSYLPYPLFSGGHIRLFNLIKELSKKHTITLICEKREHQTNKDVEKVNQFCKKIITLPRKKQWTIKNIIKAGFSSYPFLMIGHTQLRMKEEISKELKSGRYDFLHVETFYVMQNVPPTNLPVILGEQNIEHIVYKRYADNAFFFLKHLLYFDVWKMRRWEQSFWKKADWVIVTSENERKQIEKYNKHVTVVSNGVDLAKFKVKSEKLKVEKREKTVLFIGNFRWIENKDAALWLVTSIWPRLKQKLQKKGLKVKLWIVGKEIPQRLTLLARDDDVVFDENAPNDTKRIYEKADILLAPIRVGSGTKFKILESMAIGLPVVTTSVGMEGIDVKKGEEIVVADDADGLAQGAIALLTDTDFYQRIALNAKRRIEEKYDWKNIILELEKVYQSV